MDSHPQNSETPKNEEDKFIAYQTHRVPWFVLFMWTVFAIGGVIYLVRFALSDFLRWW